MTILDLLQKEGITPKKVASTRGGEYGSPCPLCGGADRFRSWPQEGDGGKWWCRQCGKSGDLIQYFRDVRGLSYHDACRAVGREPSMREYLPDWDRRNSTKAAWKPRETAFPPIEWAQKAASLVAWSNDRLRGEDGRTVTRWLKDERGLTEATIGGSRLGWVPEDLFRERKTWGLPKEMKENGKHKKLWIPRGLVIPYILDDVVMKVKIRRLDPHADPRYYLLPGSSLAPMIVGQNREFFIVVESELDAFLLHQEAGDLATTVALGSAQMRPDQKTMKLLRAAKAILLALDLDTAGARESWHWWMKRFDQAVRWTPIHGKDPTEMWQAGVPLRAWVEAGIEEAHNQDR